MRVLLLGLALLCASSESMAWSKFVHVYICELAWQQLTPTARDLVQTLSSAPNRADGYRTFRDSCTWADEVRSTTHKATYEYHFINVPRGKKRFDRQRDCARHDCVTQAIRRYALELADPDRSAAKRAEALRFLGHFVADVHQPLHVGYREDRGGNDLFVAWKKGRPDRRLHSIWDGTLAFEGRLAQLESVSRHKESLSETALKSGNDLNVDHWAEHSFQLARKFAYRIDGRELKTGDTLDDRYELAALPVAKVQIEKSAVRLATLINRASNGDLAPDDLR